MDYYEGLAEGDSVFPAMSLGQVNVGLKQYRPALQNQPGTDLPHGTLYLCVPNLPVARRTDREREPDAWAYQPPNHPALRTPEQREDNKRHEKYSPKECQRIDFTHEKRKERTEQPEHLCRIVLF